MSGAWRSLVARLLWELPIIQTKSIAITRLRLNITIYLVRVSEDFENCWEDYYQHLNATFNNFKPFNWFFFLIKIDF